MKKVLAVMMCFAVLFLAACSKSNEPFECDLCGKISEGEKHESVLMDETVEICDDCYNEIQEIQEGMQ